MRLLLLVLLALSLSGCDWTWEDACEAACDEEHNQCYVDPETNEVIACRYENE